MPTHVEGRCLGRQPAATDPRTVMLARALAPAGELPPPKKTLRLSRKVPAWPMLLNDQLGDCVPAGMLHKQQLDAAIAGKQYTPTDQDAAAVYEAVAGYRPGDPSTDQGTVELLAMRDWRKGIAAPGGPVEILGYAAVSTRNADHIRVAMGLFGGLLTGFNLPATAQGQRRWTVQRTTGPGRPGTWGGHCTLHVDYDKAGLRTVTWGGVLGLSWAFQGTYGDELWAVITREGLDAAGQYQGIDEKVLASDLGLL